MAEFRFLFAARDYARTLAFYGELLGLPVVESWDDPDGKGTVFGAGPAMIEIFEDSPHHPATQPAGVRIAIEVDDIETLEAMHATVAAASVTITQAPADQPWGHRNFTLTDPDGLPVSFFTKTSA